MRGCASVWPRWSAECRGIWQGRMNRFSDTRQLKGVRYQKKNCTAVPNKKIRANQPLEFKCSRVPPVMHKLLSSYPRFFVSTSCVQTRWQFAHQNCQMYTPNRSRAAPPSATTRTTCGRSKGLSVTAPGAGPVEPVSTLHLGSVESPFPKTSRKVEFSCTHQIKASPPQTLPNIFIG